MTNVEFYEILKPISHLAAYPMFVQNAKTTRLKYLRNQCLVPRREECELMYVLSGDDFLLQ